MIRVAAVDLGTNSTRLLIADVDAGTIYPIVRTTVVTKLGEGVDARGTLAEAAVARVHATLAGFAAVAVTHGAVRSLAVATSAVRDAANGTAFAAEVERRHGFPVRVVSGDEEAELTRRGVGAVDEGTLVLDVGGGSTELIAGRSHVSLDVGSVRITERFLRDDPPEASEIAAARAHVRGLLPALEVDAAVGVAGTVAQLHALVGDLERHVVDAELARLAALSVAERRELPGMDPARAPVIVGGALVVAEVLRKYGLPGLAFSVRDLLDGLALEAAAA